MSKLRHPPASAALVGVPQKSAGLTGIATVTADAANTDRVFAGTDPGVSVYPWLGSAVAPGATVSFPCPAGGTVYTSSPMQPGALTITFA